MIYSPHMGDSHSVLSECSSLIGADSGSRSECFDSFEILDETILRCHSLCCESETDCDCCNETFGNIGYDDT